MVAQYGARAGPGMLSATKKRKPLSNPESMKPEGKPMEGVGSMVRRISRKGQNQNQNQKIFNEKLANRNYNIQEGWLSPTKRASAAKIN